MNFGTFSSSPKTLKPDLVPAYFAVGLTGAHRTSSGAKRSGDKIWFEGFFRKMSIFTYLKWKKEVKTQIFSSAKTFFSERKIEKFLFS